MTPAGSKCSPQAACPSCHNQQTTEVPFAATTIDAMRPNQESEPAEWYLLGTRGDPTGPCTLSTLMQWHAAGRIDGSALVARRGDSAWCQLRQVTQLKPVGHSVPTPTAPDGTKKGTATSGFGLPSLIATALICACIGATTCYVVMTRLERPRSSADTFANATADRGTRRAARGDEVVTQAAASAGTAGRAETLATKSGQGPRSNAEDPKSEPLESLASGTAPNDTPPSNRAASRDGPSPPSPASSSMADQLFLARNGSDLIIWARLGDYQWRDMGMRSYWGHQAGELDWVTPVGPDSIALVGRYINSLGNVRHPTTYQEMNEPFLNDLNLMGVGIPATGSGSSTPPNSTPATKEAPPTGKAKPKAGTRSTPTSRP